MAAARAAEADHLEASAPDAAQLAARARALDPALWERRPDDADWLLLRVGWSDRDLGPTLEMAPGGEEPLRQEAEAVGARYRTLPAVPLQASLREAGVLGVSGEARRVAAVARGLGMQLAALHSPEDLILAAA